MSNKKSGRNRRTDVPSSQEHDFASHSTESWSEPPINGCKYYGLIEITDNKSGYIAWVGDVDAYVDRFGELPAEASPAWPELFGMKSLPPPGHLVALPKWLAWLMLNPVSLPVKPLGKSAYCGGGNHG